MIYQYKFLAISESLKSHNLLKMQYYWILSRFDVYGFPSKSVPIFIRAWAYATEELPTAAPARYLGAASAAMDNSSERFSEENIQLHF
ncbi:hypothetical protein KA005_71860, partial [bacterium]|nr:hypothetical protein [bacterium]